MGVIQETPEYVQLIHLAPTYAYEDKDAEWWDSGEAIRLLQSRFDTLNYHIRDIVNDMKTAPKNGLSII